MGKSLKRILPIMLALCLFLSVAGVAAGADTSAAAPNITVENGPDGIQIRWADVAGASKYEVLRKGADEEAETVIATVTSTSYTDAETLAGYKYYYKVRAVAAGGSNTVSQPESIIRSLYFGSYEQDNDLSNGKEPIEWLVTKIEDGKMFLVSKYALDSRVYNDAQALVTWETSSIRTWLNDDFLKAAFTTEEQAAICDTDVTNGANFTYKTPGGNNTVDKLFLLSLSEARSLFPTDAERLAEPTAYALARGVFQYPNYGAVWYWTRTPGYTQDCAVYVCGDGSTYFSGHLVSQKANGTGVRPALWVKADGAAAQTATSSASLVSPAINAANVAEGTRVSWTEVANAVRYAVYRKTTAGRFEQIAATGELSYVDRTVVAGTEYFYKVRAYDADGNYVRSIGKGLIAQPSADVELTAPVLALQSTANGIMVRWTSEPDAAAYKLYRKTGIFGEFQLVETTTGLAFLDNTTANGTSYYYQVRAMDADGRFLTSRERGLAATVDGAGTLDAFEINAVNKEAGISLSWPAISGAQYEVSRKIVGETEYAVLATVSRNSYLDKTAKAGVQYSYKVTAAGVTATETISRTVFFGSYEQDNDAEDGTETIEWIVLDNQDGKLLMVSKLNLDLYNLNNDYVATTWESSSLRTWLNNEFLNAAFTTGEQAAIFDSQLENEDNPTYGTKGGNNTVDKVFVLSVSEAMEYFGADGDRQADTTPYAAAQGSYPNSDFGTSWYWCRTPGYTADYFAFVSGNGATFNSGNTVDHAANAVRPAIWVSADAVETAEPREDELNDSELIFGAGVGTIEFTDEVFATSPSGFAVDAAQNVEQDLHVRVFLLKNTEEAAIVSVEIMSMPDDLIAAIRDMVADKTGIKEDNIWVHANHISSTPHAPSDDAGNAAYSAAITGAAKEALAQAMRSRQKATLTVVQGELDINRNRDTWINGLPAYGYDNLTGFSNKTITVLCFKDTKGAPIGVCYNYGVKPWVIATIGMAEKTRFYSSDISGLACLMAEEEFGCPVMYVMPATADQVTEISAKATRYNEETQKVEEYVQLTAEEGIAAKNTIGTQLGNSVVGLTEQALKAAPLKDATVSVGNTSFEWDNAKGTSTVSINVSAITIGNADGVAMVGVKPETNAITEKQLQDASPYKYTLLATFVNGDQKYMPDSGSYPNESNYNVGTFEYTKTGFAIGCAEEFVRVATDLLDAISTGTYVDSSVNGSLVGEYLGGTVEIGGYTWTILAKENGRYLVLSDTVVESRAYNEVFEETTWENSTLRKYLNEEFYNTFSDSEKATIVKTTILNEANPVYGFPGGNNTEDSVFLLSLREAEQYLNGTDLIVGKDAAGTAVYWWLRSPGEAGDVPSGVSTTGQIDYHGPISKITGVLGVRPAMWITPKAVASPQAITVNGTEVTTEAYNIYGCNYLKLRDVAMMLSGTSAQFDVGYDEATRTAAITTGAVYTPEGSEMAAGTDNSATCDVSNQKILLNGSPVSLTAYNIGGYNFIKLRDLAPLLGYDVDYNESTNTAMITA